MRNKILFYITTGLFSLLMAFSAFNYFFQTEVIAGYFEALGYPTYLLYPLGVAKVLGLVAIWFIGNPTLKEWAYAGFFFNVLLALVAHLMVGDGEFGGAAVAMVLLLGSYFSRPLN